MLPDFVCIVHCDACSKRFGPIRRYIRDLTTGYDSEQAGQKARAAHLFCCGSQVMLDGQCA
jgi:hypothetical protein